MKFEIRHTTRYTYEHAASDNINEIRLTPRTNYRQACTHHRINITPNAALFSYEDYFGNTVNSFSISEPHQELIIACHSVVTTRDEGFPVKQKYDAVTERELLLSEEFQNQFAEFLVSTAYTKITDDIAVFTEDNLQNNTLTVYETLLTLTEIIYQAFVYDTNATSVATTAQDALRLRKGVCQDFSHLMLACCRHVGIPARYTSGYHFVSDLQLAKDYFQQASHAWVEAFIPGNGWLGFDPTNNCMANWRYIKLAHGRDYRDIVPVKGNYKTLPGKQNMQVSVNVTKLEDSYNPLQQTTYETKSLAHTQNQLNSSLKQQYGQQ